MTLLERQDGEPGGSYLDLAEFLSDNGAADHIERDLEQLFRRAVFNALVENRDDHLRSHGFIREPGGWRLSPAYDVNPSRDRREHTLTFDGATSLPDLDVIAATAPLYRLDDATARRILAAMEKSVAGWRKEASHAGLPRSELTRMESAFATSSS